MATRNVFNPESIRGAVEDTRHGVQQWQGETLDPAGIEHVENHMPYRIHKRGSKYAVVRPRQGARPQRTLGTHRTKQEARRQQSAAYRNS